MSRIPVHSRKRVSYALVDAEDVALVEGRRWSLNDGYAVCKIDGRSTSMHRFILGMTPGVGVVHHVNEDKLDNRRSNLKVYETMSQANCQPHPRRDAWASISRENVLEVL